jgi:hypothetical protein
VKGSSNVFCAFEMGKVISLNVCPNKKKGKKRKTINRTKKNTISKKFKGPI